jgi:hypothetical protein
MRAPFAGGTSVTIICNRSTTLYSAGKSRTSRFVFCDLISCFSSRALILWRKTDSDRSSRKGRIASWIQAPGVSKTRCLSASSSSSKGFSISNSLEEHYGGHLQNTVYFIKLQRTRNTRQVPRRSCGDQTLGSSWLFYISTSCIILVILLPLHSILSQVFIFNPRTYTKFFDYLASQVVKDYAQLMCLCDPLL